MDGETKLRVHGRRIDEEIAFGGLASEFPMYLGTRLMGMKILSILQVRMSSVHTSRWWSSVAG